jgi:hypothetical protein
MGILSTSDVISGQQRHLAPEMMLQLSFWNCHHKPAQISVYQRKFYNVCITISGQNYSTNEYWQLLNECNSKPSEQFAVYMSNSISDVCCQSVYLSLNIIDLGQKMLFSLLNNCSESEIAYISPDALCAVAQISV